MKRDAIDTIDRLYKWFSLSHFTTHLFRKKKKKTSHENRYSTGDSSTNTGHEALDSHEGGVAKQETISEQSNDGKYQCRLSTVDH